MNDAARFPTARETPVAASDTATTRAPSLCIDLRFRYVSPYIIIRIIRLYSCILIIS